MFDPINRDRSLARAEELHAMRAATDDATAASTSAARSPAAASLAPSPYDDYLGAVATTMLDLAQAVAPSRTMLVDGARDDYAGPYTVDGRGWTAPVASTLPRVPASESKANELAGLVGPDLAARAQSGQGSPNEIWRATKRLIDKGRLPAEPAGDPPGRIRAMQRQYRIGVDGAGYTRHAAAAANKGKSLPLGDDLAMRHLDSNPHFEKVRPGDVRAGDIITLDPKPGQKMGQNVVVRDNTRLDDAKAKEYAGKSDELTMFFLNKGPFHEINVDSSWGADGSFAGGHRRETWLYDESSKQWAHQDPDSKKWIVSPDAPTANDIFHGAYRVK